VPNMLSLVAALLSGLGFTIQVNAFFTHQSPIALGIATFYAILLFLFLFRSPSKQAETSPQVWALSLGATYLPMLCVSPPAPMAPWHQTLHIGLQCLTLIGMIIALFQLGKGFGIVPAVRQVKTHGLYRWVRHPLYATEIAFMATILVAGWSWWNLAVLMLFVGLQTYRACTEENLLLAHEVVYQQYAQQVKHRFIPFVV
jgi:protein-S-isoprenylcysteine O-methyltransferase Ste14